MTIGAITNAAIAEAISSGDADLHLSVTHFKLGSAVNYTPTAEDTGLRGSLRYTGQITDIIRDEDNQLINYLIILNSDVGPFQFGEIGLYTSTGTLFALLSLTTIFDKTVNTPTKNGEIFQISIPVRIQPDGSLVTTQTLVANVGRAAEVGSFNMLDAANTAVTNLYIIKESSSGDKTLAISSEGQDLWHFSNYFINGSNIAIGAVGAGYVEIAAMDLITIESVGDIIFQLETGTNKGRVRGVVSITAGGSGRLRLNYGNALTEITTADKIQILTNYNKLMMATIAASLGSYIPIDQRGAAGGVPTLDNDSKIPTIQLNDASLTLKGIIKLASAAETQALTDDVLAVTPATLGLVLQNYLLSNQRGAANGLASLDVNAKVPASQLTDGAIFQVWSPSSQVAMLGLTNAKVNHFARRTDLKKTFILNGSDPTILGNWMEILTPDAPVSSVNGQTGAVSLTAADVNATPVNRTLSGTGLVLIGADQTAKDLSANRTINVPIASSVETLAGSVNDKALTPASLSGLLTVISAKASGSTTFTGTGLLTIDGDQEPKSLANNRTLNVSGASVAEALAGLVANKALTPASLSGSSQQLEEVGFKMFPGGLIIQWGIIPGAYGETVSTIIFPLAFPNACFSVSPTPTNPTSNNEHDFYYQIVTKTTTSCGIYHNSSDPAGGQYSTGYYIAIGC